MEAVEKSSVPRPPKIYKVIKYLGISTSSLVLVYSYEKLILVRFIKNSKLLKKFQLSSNSFQDGN